MRLGTRGRTRGGVRAVRWPLRWVHCWHRPVEVGQHVDPAFLQCATEGDELGQRLRTRWLSASISYTIKLATTSPVGFAVGGDHALVDAPGRFDLNVVVVGEQRLEPLLLLVGEELDAGVQGAAGPVERIVRAAAVAVDGLLDPASAPVQGVAGEAHHMVRTPSPRGRRVVP